MSNTPLQQGTGISFGNDTVSYYRTSLETLSYSNLSAAQTVNVRIIRIGNMVTLQCPPSASSTTAAAGSVSLGTLPPWAFPSIAVETSCPGNTTNISAGTGTNQYTITIGLDGNISFTCLNTSATTGTFASGGAFRQRGWTVSYHAG